MSTAVLCLLATRIVADRVSAVCALVGDGRWEQVKAASILSVPVVVTEQNPKGVTSPSCLSASLTAVAHSLAARLPKLFQTALGATVPLGLEALENTDLQPSYSPLAKTKFSMLLPEVEKSLKEWGTKSVVVFGIEVRGRRSFADCVSVDELLANVSRRDLCRATSASCKRRSICSSW